MKSKYWIIGLAIAVAAFTPASRAHAQTCAMQCNPCWQGVEGYRGDVPTENPAAAHYILSDCQIFSSGCDACGGASEMMRTASRSAADVARRVGKSSSRELAMVVKKDRSRLFVSTARNVVVVQGTGCNPKAIGAVVAVSKERAAELSRMGVQSLESRAEVVAPR